MMQPIKRYGGKGPLARKIVALIPEHLHYVEPYFGGGAVLLAKEPTSSEVVNDLDQWLTNFWRVLQDEALFAKFQRIVECVPVSEAEFNREWPDDSVSQAVAFFVNNRQSFSARGRNFAPSAARRLRRGMNQNVSAWLSAVDGLPEIHVRLRRVAILCRDALDVIRQNDGPQTFFYCDPPYLHDTRTSDSDYAHEMDEDAHAQLLDILGSIQGKFLLSGYDSNLYRTAEGLYGWKRVEFDVPNRSAATAGRVAQRRVEVLWRNYD